MAFNFGFVRIPSAFSLRHPGPVFREALIWEVLGRARVSRPQAILLPSAVGLLGAKTRYSKSSPRPWPRVSCTGLAKRSYRKIQMNFFANPVFGNNSCNSCALPGKVSFRNTLSTLFQWDWGLSVCSCDPKGTKRHSFWHEDIPNGLGPPLEQFWGKAGCEGPSTHMLGRTRKSAKCDSVWGLSFLMS